MCIRHLKTLCWFGVFLFRVIYAQSIDVKEYTLKNGLKLLVVERPKSPTVALRLYVKVGSVNETAGITGISHLLEHMFGKGGTKVLCTKNYEKEKPLLEQIDKIMEEIDSNGNKMDKERLKKLKQKLDSLNREHKKLVNPREITDLYWRAGSRYSNAYTSKDVTCYHRCLPSNQIELWMWITSDILLNPVFRWFYPEREVVQEERRLWYETTGEDMLYEQFVATAFSTHEYRHPIIGWMSDISRIKRKELFEYFNTYYAPNNLIISIVGDVNSDTVYSLVKKYFGRLKPKDVPEVRTVEPPQRGEKRVIVNHDAEPSLLIGYHVPKIGHPHYYVLEVIERLLSHGYTSRLYKNLVLRKKLCSSVGAYNETRKYPGLFIFYADPSSPHTCEEVEEAIYEEIEKLKKNPVKDKELEKVRNQIEVQFLRRIKTNRGLAGMMGWYEAIYSWKYLEEFISKIKEVKSEDIIEVANKYFITQNRTVGILKRE